jgi:hypothetical protein
MDMHQYFQTAQPPDMVKQMRQLFGAVHLVAPIDCRAEFIFFGDLIEKMNFGLSVGMQPITLVRYVVSLYDARMPQGMEDRTLETWVACRQRLVVEVSRMMGIGISLADQHQTL